MPHHIVIQIGGCSWPAELNDTVTAAHIHAALPIDAEVSRWGREIYFRIPGGRPRQAGEQDAPLGISADRKDPRRTEMEPGELAFWPPGCAFCIFWGKTPASPGEQPVAASDVVPVGWLRGPFEGLDDMLDGTSVRIEAP